MPFADDKADQMESDNEKIIKSSEILLVNRIETKLSELFQVGIECQIIMVKTDPAALDFNGFQKTIVEMSQPATGQYY